MQAEGPILEELTRRLAETPEDFLAEPRLGNSGQVHVAAVAADLLRSLGAPADAAALAPLEGQDARRDRNRLSVTLLLCWLLSDAWFRQKKMQPEALLDLLRRGSILVSGRTPARKFVTDPERREELARFSLAHLGYRPSGETLAQAQDRLTSLNSAERARVLQA